MSAIDAPDNQRGVVGAEQLLATVAAFTATVTVALPANVKALWVIADGGIDPPPTVVGVSSNVGYPVYNVPFTWVGGGAGFMAIAFVSGALDATVKITASPTPNLPWYVIADTGGRFTFDAALLGAIGITGLPVPNSGVLVAGSDGTDLRVLLTDTSGRLETTGGTFPAVYGAPGTAIPADALLVAGSDGVDLRALATDATGHALTIDQTLKGAVGTVGAATPVDAVVFGGTDGVDLRVAAVNTTGEVSVIDAGLRAAAAADAAAVPAKVLQVGGSDGTDLRTLATNKEGVPYAIVTVPGVGTADHPANELLSAYGQFSASGTLIAAPGAGLRFRLFALIMTENVSNAVFYVTNGNGGAVIAPMAGPATLAWTLPPQGFPLTANVDLYVALAAGSGYLEVSALYTVETV